MNKKRLVAVLATVAVVATLFTGCGSASNNSSSTPAASKIKIGLVTDEGGVNDKSFNQSADEGVKKAQKDLGVDYKVIESKSKDDYQPNIEAMVGNNSDLTIAVGFQMADVVTAVSKKYSDKKFLIIDSAVDAKNVESIGFKEQEGSFLMGIIAGKMTKTNKVGFIGGKDLETIQKFEAGFAAGVKAVNPAAAEGLMSRKTVRYADSFTDTAKGKEAATSLIGEGCDVLYHAAGGVGIGMFQKVKENADAGKKVWAIGVDLDQAVSVPQFASVILSSMVKKVNVATYNAAKDVVNNQFQGGKVLALGLKEDGVGIAPSSNTNTPKDVLDLVAKYSDKIKDGTIVVPAKPADVKTFTAPAVQ